MTGLAPQTTKQSDEIASLLEGLRLASDDLAFDEPWQLRAFALAVAAHKSGQYGWSEFQGALIASIEDWESDAGAEAEADLPAWSYYEHWINAIEAVLADHDAVDTNILEVRMRDVLDTPANRNHHEPHYEPVAVDPATPN